MVNQPDNLNRPSLSEQIRQKKRVQERQIQEDESKQFRDEGDNGMSMGKVILIGAVCAIVGALLVVFALPYANLAPWINKDDMTGYQTAFEQAKTDVTNALAGIDTTIQTAVNSAIDTINTNLTNLRNDLTTLNTQVQNMATKLTSTGTDVTAIQNQITTALNKITLIQEQLDNIIKGNDLLHNAIVISGISNVSMFTGNGDATDTAESGNATAYFRLNIKNNSDSDITINKLKIDLDPNFDYSSAGLHINNMHLYRGSDLLHLDEEINWDITDTFDSYELTNLNLDIDAGNTEYITLYIVIYYQSSLTVEQQLGVIQTMEIDPEVVLITYKLV